MSTSSRAAIEGRLDRLGRLERAVSARRGELHEEIDRLYLEAPLDATRRAYLDHLESLEQAVSRQRRKLREQINELRASLALACHPDRDAQEELARTAGDARPAAARVRPLSAAARARGG